MKKNVIIFCPFLAKGGLEKSTVNISNYLSKKHNVVIVTNSKSLENLNKISLRVKIINPGISLLNHFRLFNNIFCLIISMFLVKKNSIILSLQEPFFLLILKFLFNPHFKLVIRTPSAIENDKNIYEQKNIRKVVKNKKFSVLLYKYADLIITGSKNNKLFLDKKIKVKKVVTINNFFPKNNLIKYKKKKPKNIFFIGRLIWDKNPIFFIKSLLPILNKYDLKIHIVGDGPDYEIIKNLSYQNKKRIKLYGFIKNPFKRFCNKIDIFSINSKFDGTPNVLGEAMSYGIPCIAPKNVGLVNEFLLDGKYGSIYTPDNKKDFQEKIVKIINNYNLYIKKARYGYKSLHQYNANNTLGKIEKLISNI